MRDNRKGGNNRQIIHEKLRHRLIKIPKIKGVEHKQPGKNVSVEKNDSPVDNSYYRQQYFENKMDFVYGQDRNHLFQRCGESCQMYSQMNRHENEEPVGRRNMNLPQNQIAFYIKK